MTISVTDAKFAGTLHDAVSVSCVLESDSAEKATVALASWKETLAKLLPLAGSCSKMV